MAWIATLATGPWLFLELSEPWGRSWLYVSVKQINQQRGRNSMHLEITQIAMGLTFLAIWAFAGDILVGRKK
ncbi:MAG: hypothetical protein JXM70_30060 [Pirellulales bacterium]|nr:hypothetical protein [Pirellulales bacterium]